MQIVPYNMNVIWAKLDRFAPIALVLASMLVLAGCIFVYGIGRSAPLTMLPDLDCIEQVIRQSPEVANVQRRQAIDAEIGAYGRRGDATIYGIDYRDVTETDIRSEIRILQFVTGHLSFIDEYTAVNRKPKQADIEAVRPIMLAIEQRLADRCGIEELRSSVNESCSGVVCQPVP